MKHVLEPNITVMVWVERSHRAWAKGLQLLETLPVEAAWLLAGVQVKRQVHYIAKIKDKVPIDVAERRRRSILW